MRFSVVKSYSIDSLKIVAKVNKHNASVNTLTVHCIKNRFVPQNKIKISVIKAMFSGLFTLIFQFVTNALPGA
jgi:hypothetical protein